NAQCPPPPLVGGRLLPWDFSYPLIPESRKARLNDSRVHLLIRAPLSRRRNSTESYIVHYCLPSDRSPHGVQRTWGEISEQQAEQVFNERQIIIKGVIVGIWAIALRTSSVTAVSCLIRAPKVRPPCLGDSKLDCLLLGRNDSGAPNPSGSPRSSDEMTAIQ